MEEGKAQMVSSHLDLVVNMGTSFNNQETAIRERKILLF
jgi:hypothetical protein